MIVDGDLSNRRLLTTGLSGAFTVTLTRLSDYVGIGAHELQFCVAQSGNGRISDGHTISLNVISGPAAISVRGSAFNAWGVDSAGTSRSLTISTGGFSRIPTALPSGISDAGYCTQISDSAVLLVLKLTNGNGASVSVDWAFHCDLKVDGWDGDMPCCDLSGQGFLMQGFTYAFSFVGKGCPLFRDVSKYWFGIYYSRSSNYWSQVPQSTVSRQDQACSWSWSDLPVPGNGFVTVGVLFKSGPIVSDRPSLTISAPSSVMPTDTIELSGNVSDSRSSAISVLYVVDGDLSRITTFVSSVPSGSFRCSVSLSWLRLSYGNHEFSFYAASAGRV
jgi:hypothetical protein